MSILRKFSNPFGSSADNSWIREWYAPYWFLLPIHGLTHSLPNIFLLYYWIPAAINKMQTGIIISSFQGFSILVGIYVNKLRGNNCVIHTTWYTVCTDKEYNTKVVYSLNTTWYTVCTDKEYNTKVVYCLLYHVTGPLPCDRAFTVPLIFYSFIVDRSLMSFQSRFIYIRYLQMQYFIIDALHTYCQWIFWEYIYLYKIPSWTEIIDHTKHIYFRKCQNIC
jgi:hypothetical protein